MPVKPDLGPIHRALRWAHDAGLSQTELARRLEVSVQSITNWKTRGLPPAMYAPMAAVLGCSVEDLLAHTATAPRVMAARQAPRPYLPQITTLPTLEDALARVRSTLLAVPDSRRLAAAMTLVTQLSDASISVRTIAHTLAGSSGKRQQA